MNLEKALLELTKRPQPAICRDGKNRPVLYYTNNTYYAIKWLVKRYNDGSLKVEGYDPQEEVRRSKLKRHSQRRGKELDEQGYMQLCEFKRQTGFSIITIRRVAEECGARVKVGQNVYINIEKYFHYLDHLAHVQEETCWVTLTKACETLGLSKDEVRKLLNDGKIKWKKERHDKNRWYSISMTSILKYKEKMKKGEKDGEDNDTCS